MTLPSPTGSPAPRSISLRRRRASDSAAPTLTTPCGGRGRVRWSRGAAAAKPSSSCTLARRLTCAVVYRRRHPLIPKALGVFGSVCMRTHRLSGRPRALEVGRQALDLLAEDRSAGPRAWGYPWDMQTRWSFYPAGSPNIVATAFASSGLLEAAGPCARPDFAARAGRGRPLGAGGALDRARRVFRLSPGPAREHPQRQPPRRVACPCGPRAGSRGRGARRPSRRAGAGRAASRRLMALRGGSRAGVERLVSLGLCPDLPRPPRGSRPTRRGGGGAGRRALPGLLRCDRTRPALGESAVSRGRALGGHGAHDPGRPAPPRARRSRVARAGGHTGPGRWAGRRSRGAPSLPLGTQPGALPALVRRPRGAGAGRCASALPAARISRRATRISSAARACRCCAPSGA